MNEITIYTITILCVIHFVADFVMQPDWMARGKSKDIEVLAAHAGTYTGILAIGIVASGTAFLLPNFIAVLFFIFFNGFLHFVTDFFTSRVNARLWQEGRVHDFFVGIGADQLIHMLTFIWTYQFFLL